MDPDHENPPVRLERMINFKNVITQMTEEEDLQNLSAQAVHAVACINHSFFS